MSGVAQAFDRLAADYDSLWTLSPAGRFQREAVWRRIDPLFRRGDLVLDLGCGTGEDALHLAAAGIHVHAIDASPEMARTARARGADAHTGAMEDLRALDGPYDGAISNFGAWNCVADIDDAAAALGRLIRPGGRVALCVMGRFCAWEAAHYLCRGDWRRAFRRWRPGGAESSLGVRVQYPTVGRLARAFGRHFRLARWYGIGILVPPSYVALAPGAVAHLAAADRSLDGVPGSRALADHRLLILTRL